MKCCIFANFVKDLKFLENFQFIKDTKENYIVGTSRALKMCKDPKILINVAGRELHFLGYIDDETGVFEPAHEVVIDFDCFMPNDSIGFEKEGDQ